MTPTQLRDKLADPRTNLSALERLSSVPIRTLRRIKNGQSVARNATIELVKPHLRKAKK